MFSAVPTHPCRFLSALQKKWRLHIPKHTLHVSSPSPPLVSAEGRKAGPAVPCSPASAPQLTEARSVTNDNSASPAPVQVSLLCRSDPPPPGNTHQESPGAKYADRGSRPLHLTISVCHPEILHGRVSTVSPGLPEQNGKVPHTLCVG